jgi:glucose/arabinose dehydrogenase
MLGLIIAATALVAASAAAAPAAGAIVQRVIADSLDSPVSMAVAPDGRVLVCEQAGAVRVVRDGRLLARPFVVVPTAAVGEEGLLAVAFDPDFARNRHVYVLYTALAPSRHNRLARYTASGDTAAAGSAVTLIDLDEHRAHVHVGGALGFGRDGRLYIGTGDNDRPERAHDLRSTLGKVLRFERDGTVPADNPFVTFTSGLHRAIWARGFRNAFALAVERSTGRMFVNDVGGSAWEEIEEVRAGDHHGWPMAEGRVAHEDLRSPLHAYDHAHGCAVTGGTFYDPARGAHPGWRGLYFFADLCASEIRWLDPKSPERTGVLAATRVSGPVALAVGRDGALLCLARGSSSPTGGPGTGWGSLIAVTPAR